MKKKLAVIGLGNMGFALVKGIIDSGFCAPADITGVEKDKAKASGAARSLKIRTSPDFSAAKDSGIVILAVKPQNMKEVLTGLKPFVRAQLIISIAAGVSTAFMREHLGDRKIVRCMPNTPALVMKGITGVYCTGNIDGGEKALVELLLRSVGEVVFLEKEDDLNMVTALSGSGPAYVYYFLEALEDAGVLAGLPRDAARNLAAVTFSGSIELMKQTGKSPTELKEMVTSPGGTTIRGLNALEKGGVKGAIHEAVIQALKRARELGG